MCCATPTTNLTTHSDTIIWPIMVRLVAIENVRYVPHDALCARVVLPRARRPLARVLNMHFARLVDVTETHARNDGYRVFLVIDVRH